MNYIYRLIKELCKLQNKRALIVVGTLCNKILEQNSSFRASLRGMNLIADTQ